MNGEITERNKQIFVMVVINRMTLQTVADLKGISRGRVGQIVNKIRLQLKRLPDGDPLPDDDQFTVASMRAHRDFWERQLEKVGGVNAAG